MQLTLHPTLPSQIILGPRVSHAGDLSNQNEVQQVFVAIVKATYSADDPSATPLEEQYLPLWNKDVFFNEIRNANFSADASTIPGWTPTGPTIAQQAGPPSVMTVSGPGPVLQSLDFGGPLGGRSFSLRFRAKASNNVTLDKIQLETATGDILFSPSHHLTTTFSIFEVPVETWPAGVMASDATLNLMGVSGATIEYDWVELSENGNAIAIINADFSLGPELDQGGNEITPVTGWLSKIPTITLSADPNPDSADPDDRLLRIDESGRIIQKLKFDQPLKGRSFNFSFRSLCQANITVDGFQIVSTKGVVLFNTGFALQTNWTTRSITASWPADMADDDKEIKVILVGVADNHIDYDWIQLCEGSTALSFDGSDPVRYEHDLAIYKPRTDIVVLGQAAPPEPNPDGGSWEETVELNGENMSATFPSLVPSTASRERYSFGWQNRGGAPREDYAGTDPESFDPQTMQLPVGFSNRYFNGGRYFDPFPPPNGDQPAFTHPAAGSTVTVSTTADYTDGGSTETRTLSHSLHLPSTGPQATITYRTGPAQDVPQQSHSLQMNIDTITYDKNSGHFSVVWRGVWDYDTVPNEQYVSLIIS